MCERTGSLTTCVARNRAGARAPSGISFKKSKFLNVLNVFVGVFKRFLKVLQVVLKFSRIFKVLPRVVKEPSGPQTNLKKVEKLIILGFG